ncbi:MAG: hypothetical protein EPN48_14935 [Microbacteriaceae bacterium]|nr:MAG: hypothetical protein EPN48_14935 [Microbacteriaceae bacterium]
MAYSIATTALIGPRCADTSHYDHVADNGKMSFRLAGRMHHLGIGVEHRGKRILAIADANTVTVVHLDTGEVIVTNQIDSARTYWRNTMKAPGRWSRASS